MGIEAPFSIIAIKVKIWSGGPVYFTRISRHTSKRRKGYCLIEMHKYTFLTINVGLKLILLIERSCRQFCWK